MPKDTPKPFNEGFCHVGNGHRLYFAEYGNPSAPPAVVLHGGPGSGCKPAMLEWFDLSQHRVVLYDQRGAGKSSPPGLLAHNRTPDLIEDIEILRRELEISRWLVVGGSWGGTLAIAYAGSYPTSVSGLIVRGAFLTTKRELDWFFYHLRMLVPEAWAALTAGWTVDQRKSPLHFLTQLLQSGTMMEQREAAHRWGRYENAVMQSMMGFPVSPLADYAEEWLAKYSIQAHYFSQGCFLSERKLFRYARQTTSVPTILLHGTHDWICPPQNAMRLMRFMPHATLRWIAKGTHTASDPQIGSALQQAVRDISLSSPQKDIYY